MFDLETNIRSWNDLIRDKGNFTESDLLELENHLRDEIDDLLGAGLTEEEAFIISIKRLGNISAISNEYSKINANLWKYLMSDTTTKSQHLFQIFLIMIFTLISGTLFNIPSIFGYSPNEIFFIKNISVFILPFVALFFIFKHKINWKSTVIIMGIYIITGILVNIYPSYDPNSTETLTAFHLPIFLWLITGFTYIGLQWKDSKERMNFIRFTGESFIYGVLISCGVGVLSLFTMLIFSAIGIDLESLIFNNLIFYGICGTVMITLYLVEAKKSIVENFAPILAKIFSPLFLIAMVSFLVVMLFTRKSPFVDRNYLIGFDLMLVLVIGLVLYVISARNLHEKKNIFDYINISLVVTALIIDIVALTAILIRLQNLGITPNKVAALGENIILLGNLLILLWQYLRFLTNKITFTILEKWQTSYLNIYAIWMATVVFIFPLIFSFK